MRNNWRVIEFDGLEADDVLGIASTHPTFFKGEKIIVSNDKDMYTIPGLFLNYLKAMEALKADDAPGTLADHVEEVTEERADYEHMLQTLMGDSADGYPGIPGIGPVKAREYLDSSTTFKRVEREITRGKRKGEIEVTYEPGEKTDDIWKVVVSAYEANGLTEGDALTTARLARILRAEDWGGKEKRIRKLWVPNGSV